MDAYTQHLLGLAVEASRPSFAMRESEGGWEAWGGNGVAVFTGRDLTFALQRLLTDLGVEVPERPSREAVEAEGYRMPEGLRDLYARAPLDFLALLEGGAS